MTEKVRFDRSSRTVVTVCTCGWRDLTSHISSALAHARSHQLRAHVGDRELSATIGQALRRQAARS